MGNYHYTIVEHQQLPNGGTLQVRELKEFPGIRVTWTKPGYRQRPIQFAEYKGRRFEKLKEALTAWKFDQLNFFQKLATWLSQRS